MRIYVFAGLLAWPLAALSTAQADEREIIVTAPIEGAAIESLQGSAVLNRESIEAAPQGGLGETLKSVPGIASTFYGAGASRPIIRGLGDDRIRVLENGIGAIDASSASPDHAVTADGLDATRIEVLRGGAALAYGGNAIGGVVNVLDESIPTRMPDGLEGDFSAGYQFGNEGGQTALDLGAGVGSVAFHLSAAERESEDYATPIGDAPNSWADYNAYAGGASLIRDWGFVGAAVKRTTSQYGLPPESPGEAGGHIELEQTRYELRGDLRLNGGPFTRLDFAAQSADYEHTEFEADGAAGTTFTNQGYEARIEAHHAAFGDKLSGAIGLQSIDSDFAAVGEEAFISPNIDARSWRFRRGAHGFRWLGPRRRRALSRRARSTIRAAVRAISIPPLSRLGAFLRPAENWFFGTTLARTERAPTGIELFAGGPHLATSPMNAAMTAWQRNRDLV